MDHLLLDLEIDAACWEFLAQRIVALGGTRPPQAVVLALDAAPSDEDPDWDELTARARALSLAPGETTFIEEAETRLARMGG